MAWMLYSVWSAILIACATVGFCPVRAQTLNVYPREAEKLPSVELSELIADLTPPNGFKDLDWDYFVDGPVAWVTIGLDYSPLAHRKGWARINIGGRVPTTLRQRREEQAWSITFSTSGNPKWGPDTLSISVECFGPLVRECSYTAADALNSSRIQSKMLCPGRVNEHPEVYEIRVNGKAPALLAFSNGGGAGGVMQSLDIFPMNETKALCSVPPKH